MNLRYIFACVNKMYGHSMRRLPSFTFFYLISPESFPSSGQCKAIYQPFLLFCTGRVFLLRLSSLLYRKSQNRTHTVGLVKILTSEILQSAPNEPCTEVKELDMKCSLHMQFLGSRGTIFHPFRSTTRRFQDIAHCISFPLAPMLKFQSATKKFKLG